MLNLTRKTDYALIALAYLAQRFRDGQGPVSAKAIAEQYDLPAALLMNILKELAARRLLRSTRGATGGYELASPPEQTSLLEVMTLLEGPTRLAMCADGLPIAGQDCPIRSGCPIRGPVQRLHRRIMGFLEQMTLADLLDDRLDPHPLPAGRAARSLVK